MKINIAAHITELLYDHERVIVPNLGGFCATYKPSEIEKYGQIAPPSKELHFDPSLNFHDNVLIEDLVQKHQITYAEALETVEGFVKEVKTKLQKEQVTVGNIGRLYLDPKQTIALAPSSTNFLEDAYGLPKMEFYPLPRPAETTAVVNTTTTAVIKTTKKIPFWVALWQDRVTRNTVAIIVLFIIVIAYLSQLAQNRNEIVAPAILDNTENIVDAEASLNPFEKTEDGGSGVGYDDVTDGEPLPKSGNMTAVTENNESTVSKPVNMPQQTTETPKPVTPEVKKTTVTPAPTPAPSSTRKNYIIVTGNFGTEASADIAAKQVTAAGYVVYRKQVSATKHRVGISLSTEPQNIDAKLAAIRKKFPDAWVTNR